jgi:hypothetical protein
MELPKDAKHNRLEEQVRSRVRLVIGRSDDDPHVSIHD